MQKCPPLSLPTLTLSLPKTPTSSAIQKIKTNAYTHFFILNLNMILNFYNSQYLNVTSGNPSNVKKRIKNCF